MIVKGLIFDLDGVIAKTAELHFKAWKNEMAKIGITFTKIENSKLKGLSRMNTLLGILKINHINNIPVDMLKKIANNKNKNYIKMLKSLLTKKDILPGIKQLLKEAKKRDLKLAIASSSNNASAILKSIGLLHFFDYIVDPQQLKKGKPDPEIYLTACKGIELKPEECIGFEDAIVGIEGLKRANIFAIAITHNEKEDWSKANIVKTKTNELNLKAILDQIEY